MLPHLLRLRRRSHIVTKHLREVFMIMLGHGQHGVLERHAQGLAKDRTPDEGIAEAGASIEESVILRRLAIVFLHLMLEETP